MLLISILAAIVSAEAGSRDFLISAIHFEKELKSGSMSVLDLAPLAAKYGAQGVEYRDVYWKDKVRELPAVGNQLARMDLKATYTTVTTLYNRDQAKQKQLLQDIEDAKSLGSPLLRVQLGVRPGSGPKTRLCTEQQKKLLIMPRASVLSLRWRTTQGLLERSSQILRRRWRNSTPLL